MKRKPISELTLSELKKQRQFLVIVTFTASGAMLFLTGVILYQVFQEQQYYMSLLLLPCLGSVLPGFIGLKEVNREMVRRETAV